MLTTNHHECEQKFSDDDENESDEGEEEQVDVLEPVRSLFSDEIFPNVVEMFRSFEPNFNLIEFLEKNRITSQYEYIRLINYLRRHVKKNDEKENVVQLFVSFRNRRSKNWKRWKRRRGPMTNIFKRSSKTIRRYNSVRPTERIVQTWRRAFHLDIEEDLNQLGALTLTETNVNVDVDPLKKANERIRQLEEIVGTLR